MTWHKRYLPPDNKLWKGRPDASKVAYFFQQIQMLNLLADIPKSFPPSLALIGFCCDEGIQRNFGRPGALLGPIAIRENLAQLAWQSSSLCYDAGNIICTDKDLEESQTALGEVIKQLMQHKITPIVLGGGHELAWGHYQGIAKLYSEKRLGIVNFDAHFDMRSLLKKNKGTSGTPFLQIAQAHLENNRPFDYNCLGIQPQSNTLELFACAKKYNVQFMLAEDLLNEKKSMHFIDRVVNDNDFIYLSLCLDVFAAAYAPGVSAPQALGLTPWQVLPLVRKLATSGKVIGYDIAELSPPYDKDSRTAKLAANFAFEFIHYHQSSIA